MTEAWRIEEGEGPVVATAVHDGHAMRPAVADLSALSEAEQLREEDPHTGAWTAVAPTRLVSLRSRFEVDLNRPREEAVYVKPEDAWGLPLWTSEPPSELVAASRAMHEAYYADLTDLLERKVESEGGFVLLDLHSYNHRRDGPDGPEADPEANPEVNIGTGSVDRARWGALLDRFIDDLRAFPFLGRHLDVRENVKFMGGHHPRFVNSTFGEHGVAIAVEFKKLFMDEWTGTKHAGHHAEILVALESTIPGLLDSFRSRP